jgi:Ca2+/H+ antiporter
MVLAAVLGVIIGIAGFVPLIGGRNLARKATATSNLGEAGALLIGVFGSFAILVVPAIICIVVARDMAVPMVLAEAAALVAAAAAYGVVRLVRR